mmetsp:Transcript_5865/g.6377  ORF Transcript_5865/g.6377 Transcript_5865/m.6377 type:complete len:226 (+) Transcript_5865:142-819(+)
MKQELEAAVCYLSKRLSYANVPEEQLKLFRSVLLDTLKARFSNHWYKNKPTKGNGYRSMMYVGCNVDPVLRIAAQKSFISGIKNKLGKDNFILWIDPGSVTVKYLSGEYRHQVHTLFQEHISSTKPSTAWSPEMPLSGSTPTPYCTPVKAKSVSSVSSKLYSSSSPTKNLSVKSTPFVPSSPLKAKKYTSNITTYTKTTCAPTNDFLGRPQTSQFNSVQNKIVNY